MQKQKSSSDVLYLSDQQRYKSAEKEYVSKKGKDALKSLLHVYKGKFDMVHRVNSKYSYRYSYTIKSSLEKKTYEDERQIWLELIGDLETFVVM